VFFAQYVQTGGLLDQLCRNSPLAHANHMHGDQVLLQLTD
jgi:hypothetical protein